MNAKKMMLTAVVAAIIGWTRIVPSAYAEVSVMDVKCTPRNPWNGLVDIEYTIATDKPDADVYVNPVAYDGDRRITLFPSSFTGDGATNTVKAGKHTMVWDAKKDFGTFSSANFQIKIYAGERLARYVVIDLSGGNAAENYPVRLSHVGPDLSDDACRTTNLWLRLVPPGEFWMGSPEDEVGRSDNEDLHHVTLTKPFYIGVFPVTVQQWNSVCTGYYRSSLTSSGGPTFAGAPNANILALDNVGVYDFGNNKTPSIRGVVSPTNVTGYAQGSFIGRLRSCVPSVAFDLPTEAQWEYACRAGTVTALYNGKNLSATILSKHLSEIASYYGNRYNNRTDWASADVGPLPVGSFMPNNLGLYDMLGNCWEVCRDSSIDNDHLGHADLIDPQPCANSDPGLMYYIRRGGEWRSTADSCRAACRTSLSPWVDSSNNRNMTGFRLCAEADF